MEKKISVGAKERPAMMRSQSQELTCEFPLFHTRSLLAAYERQLRKITQDFDDLEPVLAMLNIRLPLYQNEQKKAIEDLIKSINELKENPRRSLLPAERMEETLMGILENGMNDDKELMSSLLELHCAISSCKTLESVIIATCPEIRSSPFRSSSHGSSTRPRAFYKELSKSKHNHAKAMAQLRKLFAGIGVDPRQKFLNPGARCTICNERIPKTILEEHTARCRQAQEQDVIIKDADKIFLRIDSSATNLLRKLMQNSKQESPLRGKEPMQESESSDSFATSLHSRGTRGPRLGSIRGSNMFRSGESSRSPLFAGLNRTGTFRPLDSVIHKTMSYKQQLCIQKLLAKVKLVEKLKNISRKAFGIRLAQNNESEELLERLADLPTDLSDKAVTVMRENLKRAVERKRLAMLKSIELSQQQLEERRSKFTEPEERKSGSVEEEKANLGNRCFTSPSAVPHIAGLEDVEEDVPDEDVRIGAVFKLGWSTPHSRNVQLGYTNTLQLLTDARTVQSSETLRNTSGRRTARERQNLQKQRSTINPQSGAAPEASKQFK